LHACRSTLEDPTYSDNAFQVRVILAKAGIHRRGGKSSEFRDGLSMSGEAALANIDSRLRGNDGCLTVVA